MLGYRHFICIAALIALSGCGSSPSSGSGSTGTHYEVALTWDAPSSSSDPVAGYNVYRTVKGGSYALLNTSVDTSTQYADTHVQNGVTYDYFVESVDANGNQSAPSNTSEVAIPSSESAAMKIHGALMSDDPTTGARVIILPAHQK